jgi:hypothetical protein
MPHFRHSAVWSVPAERAIRLRLPSPSFCPFGVFRFAFQGRSADFPSATCENNP